nr:peptidoglycan-binding protein [uncultured Cohaesibacter sp.]
MSETYDDYENWEDERKTSPLTLVGILVMAIASTAIIGNALFRQPKSAEYQIMNSVRNENLNAQKGSRSSSQAAIQVNKTAMTLSIQNALTISGYYVGPIDGVEGAQTKEAIAAYQDAIGMKVTGAVSQELYDIVIGRKQIAPVRVAKVERLPVESSSVQSTAQSVMPGVLPVHPVPQPQGLAQETEQELSEPQSLEALPRIKPHEAKSSSGTTGQTAAKPAYSPVTSPAPVELVNAGPVPPENIPSASAQSSAGDPILVKVQKALKKIGYENLTVDGVMGSRTKSAIANFQRSRGHPVTGQVNDRLLQEMMVMGYLDLG